MKDVEKSLRFWAVNTLFLILALKGIYVPGVKSGLVENKRMAFLIEVIRLLRLCLTIKSLVEQLLA